MTNAKTKTPTNPYLDGRREWSERYGSYIQQAATWRLVACSSMAVTALAVGGLSVDRTRRLLEPGGVPGDVVADEAGDEEVRVVVAILHAQGQGRAAFGRR